MDRQSNSSLGFKVSIQPTPAGNRPSTCIAAIFRGATEPLELRELPIPAADAGEAIVRIDCCTLCGSDLHTITGARTEPVPSILGHEILGTIREVGDPPPRDIDGCELQPGDRVTWSTCISCGHCDRCHRGLPQKCRTLAKYGHEIAQGRNALSGGLAEYILLRPGSTVVRLNRDVPDEVLCPANCATATVAAAYRGACPVAGRRVLIFGAGLLGLTASAFAKSSQASQVIVCDLKRDRLRLAGRFGADGVVEWHADHDELRQRLSQFCGTDAFDLIMEFSGSPDAVESACQLADVGASVMLVGTVMKSRSRSPGSRADCSPLSIHPWYPQLCSGRPANRGRFPDKISSYLPVFRIGQRTPSAYRRE